MYWWIKKTTNSIIIYKNKEQYFNTDFNNKNNLKNWLKAQSLEKQKEYCKDFLIKRKEKKGLEYTPSQVELRSVLSPSVIYLQEIFGDYYQFAGDLGFKNKYIYPESLDNLAPLPVNYAQGKIIGGTNICTASNSCSSI